MKAKIAQTTIETPEEIASGVYGDAAWVKFRTRYKRNKLQLLTARNISAAKVSSITTALEQLDDDADDPRSIQLAQDAIKALDEIDVDGDNINKFLAYAVVAWNWIDEDTGEPLPSPDKKEVFNTLYEEQFDWLMEQVHEIRAMRGAEGNAPNTTK